MEEIINTAECNNLKENGKCKIPHFYERIKYTSCNCNDIDDCYYKQLKRLEQENDDLKQTIKELNESIQTCNVERTKLYRKLEKIEELCTDLISENEEYASIAQVLQIIRGEE